MDTATPSPVMNEPSASPAASPRPVRRRSTGGPEQAALPLDDVTQDLPAARPTGGDDAHDRPIGFALTARARRVVAPASLPELAVVPQDDRGSEQPDDTRPARARALRRAGVPIRRIAEQLKADPLLVTAWTGEVAGRAARAGTISSATGTSEQVDKESDAPAPESHEQETARALARAAAASAVRRRLGEEPELALSCGLLASIVEVDEHAVTVTSADARVVRLALEALVGQLPEARALARVVVRVGPAVAGDLVRHRLATDLGIDLAQVTWTRWKGASSQDAVQLLLRVADPALADQVAGMVEAVLEPATTASREDF